MSVISIAKLRKSAVLLTALSIICFGVSSVDNKSSVPRKCCSPDSWEADVKNIGATTRIRDSDGKITAKLSHDYANLRWAFDYNDPNEEMARRLVYDYKANYIYLIHYDGCYKRPLNAQMQRYCIPENATYNGYYDHQLYNVTLGYDVWSYEVIMSPIRVMLKVSRKGCIPLQESSYTLIKNRFRWHEGEPNCIPWMFPEQAASGECFKSHNKRVIERMAATPTAFLTNMDLRNLNTTITNQNIFKVPSNCTEVDEWPEHIAWNDFWRVLIFRRKNWINIFTGLEETY